MKKAEIDSVSVFRIPRHLTEEPKHLKQDSNLFILLRVSHGTETAFLKPLQIAVTSTNGFPGERQDAASGQPEPRAS